MEVDHELRRLPPPSEKQDLERRGLEFREDPISGAATGELSTIIIAAIAGVSGGLLGAMGADLWALLKTYLKKRFRQLETDRRERAPEGGRFRVERIYVSSQISGVPVNYYFTPCNEDLDLDVNEGLLASAEHDVKRLVRAGKLTESEFLEIHLNSLGQGAYFRKATVRPNVVDAIMGRHDVKSRAYTHALVAMKFEEMALWEDAIRHYRICLEAYPDDAGIRKNLGADFARKGDLDSALREYRRALDLDGRAESFHYNVACFYAFKGDARTAAAELKLAVDAGYRDLDFLLSDPDFSPVIQSPEVLEVVAIMKERS